MNLSDISIIGKVYLISLVWQLISWPFISWFFKDLADKGWAMGRLVTTLIVSLVIWQLAIFGLPVNTNWGVLLLTAVMLVGAAVMYKKRGLIKKAELIKAAKYISLEEYLFIVGLVALTVIRGFMPDIHNLEKFMDFGFVNRYLLSSGLPAEDMWYAGGQINYYSFGHFWASILIRFLSVNPAIGYNLVLAIILGFGLMLAFSVASNLIHGKDEGKIIGGLVAALAVCVGGNSHTIWYFLNHLSFKGYWYAEATRFIYNTIHEFPSYSFVVSDLHGHLLDFPMVLLFILILYYWSSHKGRLEEVVMGILLGVMMMTNTWDLPIYLMLGGIFCLFELINHKTDILKLAKTALIIFLSAVLVALPWWLSFVPISSGIGIVSLRSPLWQLAVLWTGGFISLLLASLSARKSPNRLLVWAMVITSVILIIIPELIYAKDIYPSHPRANTMFKLTYQSFILMGLSLGIGVGQLIESKRGWRKTFGIMVGLTVLGSALLFPIEAFPSFYGDFKSFKGLNGEAWLNSVMPERYGVIEYLRGHRDNKNMVEAVGDSYTDYNAISVFSGVPTIEGWRVHEWLWRGGYTPVGIRDTEVRTLYESGDRKEVLEIVKKYNVGWIVIGSDELSKYKVNENMLSSFGSRVYEDGGTYLLRLTNY